MKLFVLIAMSACTLAAQIANRGPVNLPDSISNLPLQKIGIDDLLGISVYDSPELTRTLRVAGNGTLNLPMLKRRIPVSGLLPSEVESAIVRALQEEEILVAPVVTVSVVEYRSRPISVVGAVKKPISFQASGTVNLLEVISRAEGLAEDAGPDILISRSEPDPKGKPITVTRRISVKALLDAGDPELNLLLEGGEEIRVPSAGKFFVVGNVKKPGSFPIRDASATTVLKALAVSEGLMPFAAEIAYVYREDDSKNAKLEIPIELARIMKRKSPDVPLMANDILYIPDRSGKRAAIASLEKALAIGVGLGTAAILVTR